MRKTVIPEVLKASKGMVDNAEWSFCWLCERELKGGMYRYNDMSCPPLTDGIPDTRTCMEDCMIQNKAIAEALFKLAAKKRLLEGEHSKEALSLEKEAKAMLKCGT
jgi:hypothetical protein